MEAFFYCDASIKKITLTKSKHKIMKTIILTTTMLLFTILTLEAQKATIKNDTAKYNGRNFTLNDTIMLGYGSKSDKSFAFIQIGSALQVRDLNAGWAKNNAVIEKVSIQGNSVILRAKLTDKTVNLIGGNKLFINLEAAIDNKELY